MRHLNLVLALLASMFILLSFSTNPPDGKTGAPGDSLCSECHTPQSSVLGGTISVEGFPASINPGETYVLTIVNRDTMGDAVRGGFQMTILNQLNLKSGTLANPSANAAVANAGGRQYVEHNPAQVYPDSNVVKWTVDWTAPADAEPGSTITWYAAGNITNGNFQNTGDKVVTANGSGSVVLSSVQDPSSMPASVFPNPGVDQVQIRFHDGATPDGVIRVYSLTGEFIALTQLEQGRAKMPDMNPGIYILDVTSNERRSIVRWMKQ